MMKFISLGSGSSGNCYFLYTESDGLLIDAGRGLRTMKKYFREYGLPLHLVHHLLITHDHADHVKSVGKLSAELNLPVYTTNLVHAGINRNYCVRSKVPPQLIRTINPGESFTAGEFKIETGGVVFCLLTDVGHITDDIKSFISEANYLVLEANHDEEMLAEGPYPQHLKDRILSGTGHLSNRDCAEAVANNATSALRHLWLCHLSEENNHPELARKTVEQVLRSYGIAPGKDFLLDVLKSSSTTLPWCESCLLYLLICLRIRVYLFFSITSSAVPIFSLFSVYSQGA